MAESPLLVYTVDISGSTSEKLLDGSSNPIPFKTLVDASKAVCKVEVGDSERATGFLAKFPAPDGSLISGIFTNNHVLSEEYLADGKTFKIQFDAVLEAVRGGDLSPLTLLVSTTGMFRFTCPVLDATFVRFGGQVVQYLLSSGCQFLEVTSEWDGSTVEPVFIFQHPGGADISIAQGHFLQCYGIDVFHSVSTDFGSSGSPVALSSGVVIGVHKARAARNCSNYNVAVGMKAVIKAILPFFCRPFIPQLFCNPIILDKAYAAKLLEIGLQRCFILRASKFQGLMYISHTRDGDREVVTRIWYVPTSHGWYWTPSDPSDREKETNWMPVSQLVVVGGYRHGQIPPLKIIKIIDWLYQHNIDCNECPPL